MNHNHMHCAHALAYCGTCDVAYCKHCSKQWGAYTYTITNAYTSTPFPAPTLYSNASGLSPLMGHAHEGASA